MSSKHGLQAVIRIVVGVSLLGSLIALTFLGALHSPGPNGVDLAVVAPRPVAAELADRLKAADEDAFDVTPFGSIESARRAILHREVDAAFAPGPGTSTLLVAGAGGAMGKANLTDMFRGLTAASGGSLEVEDVRPSPAEDRAGLSPFLLTVSLLIPSLLLGVALCLGAPLASGREADSVGSLAGACLLGPGQHRHRRLRLRRPDGPLLGARRGRQPQRRWRSPHPSSPCTGSSESPVSAWARCCSSCSACRPPEPAIGPDYIPEAFGMFTTTFPAGEAVHIRVPEHRLLRRRRHQHQPSPADGLGTGFGGCPPPRPSPQQGDGGAGVTVRPEPDRGTGLTPRRDCTRWTTSFRGGAVMLTPVLAAGGRNG